MKNFTKNLWNSNIVVLKNIYNKQLIIIGSARSGTSWLSELMARRFRYRLLFEPEHPKNTKNGFLLADKLINDFSKSPESENYLRKIFANKVDCDWIAQNSNRKYKLHLWPFLPKKIIIKFVRCNLAAKAINEHFKIPLIHLLRDPYTTIASQKRVKFPWLFDFSGFQSQDKVVSLIYDSYNFDISDMAQYSEIEQLAIRWCIENAFALKKLEPYNFKSAVIKYEDLLNNSDLYMSICEDFNIRAAENIKHEYARPSSKTHPNSNIIKGNLDSFVLSKDEYAKINKILFIFESDLYPFRTKS